MGLLQQYGINVDDIERILISVEDGEYRVRLESITIEGKNISSKVEVDIHNHLVNNDEFDSQDELRKHIASELGVDSVDLIEFN